jgi:hypothetical protein
MFKYLQQTKFLFCREKPKTPPRPIYEVSFHGNYWNGIILEGKKYISVEDLIESMKILRKEDPMFDKGYKAIQQELERYYKYVNSKE